MPTFIKYLPVVVCLSLALAACHSKEHGGTAIRDFNPSLQPLLVHIVTDGVVGPDSLFAEAVKLMSDQELKQLSLSEHPVLRATALTAMLYRESFDPMTVLMEHLDDTAVVTVDIGEWGTKYSTVSDRLINESTWKSYEDKDKVIDAVLRKHNYLESAYTVLWQLTPGEKYRPYVKAMAQRGKDYSLDEKALEWLAKYNKPEDTALTRSILERNLWHLGDGSFDIIRDHPSEAYFELLTRYRQKFFYQYICNPPSWSKFSLMSVTEMFIGCVAAFKNAKSAAMLSGIVHRKPFLPCTNDSATVMDYLQRELWHYRCPAYDSLIAPFRKKMLDSDEAQRKHDAEPGLQLDVIPDTGQLNLRWNSAPKE